MSTLVRKGAFAQIEINNVAFQETGRIEAQCKSVLEEGKVLENGMIVEVDNFTRTVKPTKGFTPADGAVNEVVFGINYSTEHIYDDRTPGLENYAVGVTDHFLPRIGLLQTGDIFTTNAVEIDAEGAEFEQLKTQAMLFVPSDTTPGYLTPGNGKLPLFKAVKRTTMPDGSPGIKFQVIKAD